MRIRDLEAAVGGLSTPSKIPGLSYGIPATECAVGSVLRKIRGTVCSKCYAHKGMYVFPNVRKAQAKRLRRLSANLERWRENMATLIRLKYRNKKGADRVFRWHDSGDIQSPEHLEAIVWIARELSDIRFWIPTKEYGMVRRYLSSHPEGFPSNLAVRVSAPIVGRAVQPIPGTVSSTVASGKGYVCPAQTQGNECGSCRACWDKSVESVDYHAH